MDTCETCQHWKPEHNDDFGACGLTDPDWMFSHPDEVMIRPTDHEGDSPVETHKNFACNQHKPKP